MWQQKKVEFLLGSVWRQPFELASLFVYQTRLLRIYFRKTEHFLKACCSTIKFWLSFSAALLFVKGDFNAAQGTICLIFQPTWHLWAPCSMAASYGGKPASLQFKAVHQNGVRFCTCDVTWKCSIYAYCFLPQINTADHSSSQWVTCFQDTAAEILGCSAQELGELRDQDSPDFNNVFQKANFKDFIFRVRAKMDNYNVSWMQFVINFKTAKWLYNYNKSC